MKLILVAISISLFATLLLAGGSFVIAATQPIMPPTVKAPFILPTNPLYAIKEWWRTLQLKFENNPIKQVDLEQLQMQQRLIDVQALFAQPIDAKAEAAITKSLDKYKQQEQQVQQQLKSLQEQVQDQETVKWLLRMATSQNISQQHLLEQMEQRSSPDNTAVQAALTKTIKQSLADLTSSVAAIVNYADGESHLRGAAYNNGTGSIFEGLISGDILQRVSALVPKEQAATVSAVAQQVITDEVEKISGPHTDVTEQKTLLERFLATPYDPTTFQALSSQPVLDRQLDIIANQTAAEALQDTANLFK